MFTFGLQTFVCAQFLVFSRMSWLNICFTQIFFSILISVWSFQCTQVRYTVLCFWPNGDGEIRTLDPLLARQVLSQLSYTPIWNIINILFLIWQPPAFPYRHQYSIIGRFRLNHRVRDVDGCFPKAHRHQKYDVIYSGLSLVLVTRSITLPLHLARVIRPIRLRFHSILLINQRLSCPLIRQSSLITKQWITFTRFP